MKNADDDVAMAPRGRNNCDGRGVLAVASRCQRAPATPPRDPMALASRRRRAAVGRGRATDRPILPRAGGRLRAGESNLFRFADFAPARRDSRPAPPRQAAEKTSWSARRGGGSPPARRPKTSSGASRSSRSRSATSAGLAHPRAPTRGHARPSGFGGRRRRRATVDNGDEITSDGEDA